MQVSACVRVISKAAPYHFQDVGGNLVVVHQVPQHVQHLARHAAVAIVARQLADELQQRLHHLRVCQVCVNSFLSTNLYIFFFSFFFFFFSYFLLSFILPFFLFLFLHSFLASTCTRTFRWPTAACQLRLKLPSKCASCSGVQYHEIFDSNSCTLLYINIKKVHVCVSIFFSFF